MNASNPMSSVYAKLQQARIALQSANLKKSGHNKFAGYYYFELGDFLPAVNQIFADLGLCSVVSFGSDLATLKVIDVATKEEIVFTSPMAEAQLKGCHPIQNLGAVETYSRRYLYVTAMEIVEHDALDATTGKDKYADPKTEALRPKESGKSVSKATLETLSEEAQDYLKSLAKEVLECLPDEASMFEAYEERKKTLDSDEQVAWWAFFDSKSRAALKRGKDAAIKPVQATEAQN